ncbi:MAG: hypothetical protein FJ128_01300 [Deltaproteobacteria bacterium]|nr:hypothetical protein [Deltaproteobacteria bacterium]
MEKRNKFAALLGFLAFLLVNYPLLGIGNREAFWAGVPVLIWYLHGVWLLAIVGLYILGARLISRE